jgi:hypothetical protein
MKTEGSGGARELGVDETSLDDRPAIQRIKLKHAPHARHLYDYALRQSASRKARASAARSKRDALAPEHAQDFRDLFRIIGEDDRQRALLVLRQSVALVDEKLIRLSQHRVAADNRAQVLR